MKVLAIGKNYVLNAEDLKTTTKSGKQLIFSKPESSLTKDNKDVAYPAFTENLVYEVELVVEIGKTGKNIAEADAASYISGIAVGIDYTAKDVLNDVRESKGPWDLAKGFDGAAPISPVKAVSNFADLKNINFDLKINGDTVQEGNTSLIIYNFEEIIAFVSQYFTLEPGDLIFTGTPAYGTGQIHKGDHLQASIEGELLLDFKMI
ncbi:fumarylacetoacetate hydrolase family protein [Formosa algae]|uniref:2-keto-4-pentenoate hydratase/2-oxohepta-3-ene-1,7-dioic acid hydratase in catechol pathway n=1 Tax=Formosa algae TaxID=225843 RepID=A0A9X0YPR3_9FLAO|nr:fumarylacetoacetate hydrolase family protein [Formosa algae]MBP1840921.1 2-keto-4-pentenoate hydratase/2-oxohepta-3-ene-1,7-dioic acid hydratase in catechol pathway [Formosa algae]MDQ0336182.1 2-keto-4-pentenoate hydratase/2-oxohepta-3-ene-1,7-dioic acid hydratase in catechol pathway [Formosa algae]OEI79956.1 fumarylacetoacetate hydrolase [Formosa algae]